MTYETTLDPLLHIRDVERITSLSRTSITRLMAAGRFPEAVRLSERGRVAWRSSDVMAWNESPLDWGRDPFEEEEA
jgi:predicted DNA-binding transcriptional regulator AlpA